MKVLSILGSLASIIGLPIALISVQWENFSFENNWIKLGIAGFFLLLLIVTLINNIRLLKNKNTGIKTLLELQENIANDENEIRQQNYEACQIKLHRLCSKIAKIFKQLKGSEVAVCLKVITEPEDVKLVKTIARDNISFDKREDFDKYENDKLEDNSDFCELFYQHKELNKKWCEVYYRANNLPHLYGYLNSHMDNHKISNGTKGFFTRHIEWKLPYMSTLIVAIGNKEKDELYAFLCIDSKRAFFFKESDVEDLKKVASIIWNLIGITIMKSQYKIVNG